ncbi:MAG: histidine phosphatase family protein [Rhodospirillaceae bacterium]|nr:histidine phosphatase family protein [Rhodospirillaceae bacterium]
MSVTVTRWWWIRHAPVIDDGGCFYGQADLEADTGDMAAHRALAEALPLDAVWVSSHLRRARQTAAAIGEAGYPLPEVQTHRDLAEQHFGDWQGTPRQPA